MFLTLLESQHWAELNLVRKVLTFFFPQNSLFLHSLPLNNDSCDTFKPCERTSRHLQPFACCLDCVMPWQQSFGLVYRPTCLLVLSQHADVKRGKLPSHVVRERQVPIVFSPRLAHLRVGLQGGLQLLRLCAVSEWHIQADLSSNSLEVAVCALQVQKKKCESSSLLTYSSLTYLEGASSPPYTSSMHTIPSPAFSMWVMVTVAARPDAKARPAGSRPRSERETLQSPHIQTHFYSSFFSTLV